MEDRFARYREMGQLMQNHGLEMIVALAILIAGLFLTKWAIKGLKNLVGRFTQKPAIISIIANSMGIFLLSVVITAAAMEIGAKPGPLITFMMILVLSAIGIIVVFRPLLPTLPFKVGNTVMIGDLLGKVEATTVLNTRLRTFDGKTFFVPNRQILDDIVINYHFTQTRRIKLDFTIRYDQDILKAKQTLEALMRADARIKIKPLPKVYVLELDSSGVRMGGRCWVDNIKYWATRCEMLEKIKLRFDHEGIQFAYPQLDVHFDRKQGGSISPPFMDETPGDEL